MRKEETIQLIKDYNKIISSKYTEKFLDFCYDSPKTPAMIREHLKCNDAMVFWCIRLFLRRDLIVKRKSKHTNHNIVLYQSVITYEKLCEVLSEIEEKIEDKVKLIKTNRWLTNFYRVADELPKTPFDFLNK